MNNLPSFIGMSFTPPPPSGDPDANAFIAAAGISDSGQQSALQTLVTSAKTNGWWSLCIAIYPFVGGTAFTHKWNLKNPLDTNAAFRLTFVDQNGDSWTHNSDGAKGVDKIAPGGTYANTYITPTTHLTENSMHVLSSCDIVGTDGPAHDYGCWHTDPDKKIAFISHLGASLVADAYNETTNRIFVASGGSTGRFIMTRNSSTDLKAYRNATLQGSDTDASSGFSFLTYPIYLGAVNSANSFSNYSSGRTFNFITIGTGVSAAIASLMDTDISTFNAAIR